MEEGTDVISISDLTASTARSFSLEQVERVLFHPESPILKGLKLPACREFLYEAFIADDNGVFSPEEVLRLNEQFLAAAKQKKIKKPQNKKKWHTHNLIEDQRFKIVDQTNSLHDYRGTTGWPSGIFKFNPEGSVVVEFEVELFLTKLRIFTRNNKSSPKGFELWAEEADGEWKLKYECSLGGRQVERNEPPEDYEKFECFYLVGDASSNTNVEPWEAHPLANPGTVKSSSETIPVARKWKVKLVGESLTESVKIDKIWFYGRNTGDILPAAKNVSVKFEGRDSTVSWEPPETGSVKNYVVVAFPGGSGAHLYRGGICESCPGDCTELTFSNLVPNAPYSFQVIAVGADGLEGVPSALTPSQNTTGEWEFVLGDDVPAEVVAGNNMPHFQRGDTKIERWTSEKEEISATDVADANPLSDSQKPVARMLAGDFKSAESVNASRCITIFVSGTSEDTRAERDYLMEYGYPYAKLMCQSQGFEFAAVDLQWGLGKESSVDDDHSIVKIHLNTLNRSIRKSAAAGFVYFSTEKYGYRALPAVVPIQQMDLMESSLQDGPSKDVLLSWYARDDNSVPPVYVLQPVSTMAQKGCTFLDDPKRGVRGDQSILQEMILNVASSNKDLLQDLWVLSLSEREVRTALTSAMQERLGYLCFMRTIDGLDKAVADEQDKPLNMQKARIFAPKGGADVIQVENFRKEISSSLSESDQKQMSIQWIKIGDKEASAGYLADICSAFIKKVENIISSTHSQQQVLSLLDMEVHSHASSALEKSSVFVGRASLKSYAQKCIIRCNRHIAVICGEEGSGRTSLMCRLACTARTFLPDNTNVIIRLCATTPESSNAREILQSLCLHIVNLYPSQKATEIPTAFEDLVDTFHALLKIPTMRNPLIIFLDGIEGLGDTDNACTQPWRWLPRKVPSSVRIVVSVNSDQRFGVLEVLKSGLPDSAIVPVPKLMVDECSEVLDAWMTAKSRTLSEEQMAAVQEYIKQCSSSVTAVHLKLLFDRIVAWRSYESPGELPATVQGFVNLIYSDMERKHGQKVVSRVMQLLLASKNGLTSENIIDLISADDMILGRNGQPGTLLHHYDPPIRRMPPMVLMQLKRDLARESTMGSGRSTGDYLIERVANDVTVLNLYHQQFEDVARERYLKDRECLSSVSWLLAEYFSGDMAEQFPNRNIDPQPLYFGAERIPNKQRLDELPWALLNSGEYGELADLLCDLDYVEAKCHAGLTFTSDLIEEYTQAIAKAGESDIGRLIQYHRFVTTWFQVLSVNPTPLAGLALNYVVTSAVTKDAQERWNSRTETRPWIKWHNSQRVFDPVISSTTFPMLVSCTWQPGTTIAAATGNSYCVVFDALFRRTICEYKGHSGWIWDCCFSPDGTLVLSVSSDSSGHIWTANEGKVVEELVGHTGWVVGCAWSPLDSIVLTVSTDKTARLWNPYMGFLVGVLVGHHAPLKCGTFNPKGDLVFTGDSDGEVVSWSVENCVALGRIKAHNASVNCITWSSNGARMATASDDETTTLWDSSQQFVSSLTGHKGPVRSCSFSSNDQEIVTTGADRTGRLYNVSNGELASMLTGHLSQVTEGDWQGRYILTVSDDGLANVWEREFLSSEHILGSSNPVVPRRIMAMDFRLTGQNSLELHLLDDRQKYFVAREPFLDNSNINLNYICGGKPAHFTSAHLSPDGLMWAYGTNEDFTFVFNAKSGKQCKDIHSKVGASNMAVAWHPLESGRLLIGGFKQKKGALKLLDTQTKKVVQSFNVAGPVASVAWSGDGQYILVTGEKSSHLFDAGDPSSLMNKSPTATFGASTCACFSPDSTKAAFILKGVQPKVYDIEKGTSKCQLTGKFWNAGAAVFSSDSSLLFVAFGPQQYDYPSVQVFNAGTGTQITWFLSPYSSLIVKLASPPMESTTKPYIVAGDDAGRIMILELQQRV